MRRRLRRDRRIGENALHRGLGVVEVAADADCVDVGLGRRHHLEPLHPRSSLGRIEDRDLGAVHAGKALHRRGAGVAARRRQHQHAPPRGRVAHEDRQHRQGHVLERAGAPVEELEEMERALLDDRHRVGGGKAREEPLHGVVADALGHVAEELREHQLLRPAQRVGGADAGDLADADWQIQPAVAREPAEDGLDAGRLLAGARRNVGYRHGRGATARRRRPPPPRSASCSRRRPAPWRRRRCRRT